MKFCPKCSTLLRIVDNLNEMKVQTGGGQFTDLINAILESKSNIKKLADDLDISDITKSSEYKQLSLGQQEIVFNKIQELLPSNKKKIVEKKKTMHTRT